MKACARLHDYRDGLLHGAVETSFEAHLADCDECRKSVSLWGALEHELGEMDREGKQRIPQPSAAARQALVARARGARGPSFAPRLVAAVAALALVIVGVALYLTQTDEGPTAEERDSLATAPAQNAAVQAVVHYISPTDTKTEDLSLTPGDVIPAAENSRTLVLLGRDRIGLDEPTEAVLAEVDEHTVRLKLLAGTIACDVAPRGDGQAFVIEAGEATVRVVGTRFMVSRAEVSTTVVVDEGVVEVRRRGKRSETTTAGQGLEIIEGGIAKRIEASQAARSLLNQLITEHRRAQTPHRQADDAQAIAVADAGSDEATQPGPAQAKGAGADRGSGATGLETWRTWVLAGQYDAAERALTAHLAQKPNDSEALVLLANCRRKAGRWRAAASTYERVIQVAGPSRANMARFKAGVLYQERLGEHASAAKLFDGYLRAGSGPKPMQPEAMLRLGRSLLALGRTERARAVLERVAARQDGNPASLKALELLKKITGEK
jgi:ferric-dicitrate binding protein FerR (iron transport regulator)